MVSPLHSRPQPQGQQALKKALIILSILSLLLLLTNGNTLVDALFGARGQSKLLLAKAAAQELRRVQLEEEDEDAAVAQTEVNPAAAQQQPSLNGSAPGATAGDLSVADAVLIKQRSPESEEQGQPGEQLVDRPWAAAQQALKGSATFIVGRANSVALAPEVDDTVERNPKRRHGGLARLVAPQHYKQWQAQATVLPEDQRVEVLQEEADAEGTGSAAHRPEVQVAVSTSEGQQEPWDIAAELQHAQKAEAEGVAQAQAQADGEAAAQAASEQPEGAAVHTRAQELPQDTSEQVDLDLSQQAAADTQSSAAASASSASGSELDPKAALQSALKHQQQQAAAIKNEPEHLIPARKHRRLGKAGGRRAVVSLF